MRRSTRVSFFPLHWKHQGHPHTKAAKSSMDVFGEAVEGTQAHAGGRGRALSGGRETGIPFFKQWGLSSVVFQQCHLLENSQGLATGGGEWEEGRAEAQCLGLWGSWE